MSIIDVVPDPTAAAGPAKVQPPLCIDLDGTLLRTDVLFESMLALFHINPLYVFVFPLWLLRGRARLKREIARRVKLDPATLPYDERLCELVRRATGTREVVLCTAADQLPAEQVAAHVGGFHAVLASDGSRNLSGRDKADALVARYGERGFDYAGNERRDLPVWRHARRAIVVNAHRHLAARAGRVTELAAVLPREGAGFSVWLRALRLHQWLKNALIFVPLLAAHRALEPAPALRSLAAFVIFGVCASGVYVLNDLLDLDSDRRHARKRERPFASGHLPLSGGFVVAACLAVAAFIAAWWVAPMFALTLGAYYIITLAYSLHLKRVVMLDVLVLAGLYTLRLVAGSAATGIALSFWLLVFAMFLFLSLALVKRYTEVLGAQGAGDRQTPGRGYVPSDYELLVALGGASGYISVLVLAMYINSTASEALYRRPQVLWLLCPLLLYWISRVWVVAHRGLMHDDPLVFAVRDRVGLVVLSLCAMVILLAV